MRNLEVVNDWFSQYRKSGLEALSKELGIAPGDLFEILKGAGFTLKKGDRYWLRIREGASMEEVAEEFDVSVKAVRAGLLEAKHTPPRTSRPKAPKKNTVYRTFLVSTRLANAYRDNGGLPFLREGLMQLGADPASLVIENTGIGEETTSLSISLSPVDLQSIEHIDQRHREISGLKRRENKSVVVRQAIERAIASRGLKEPYCKPPGWQSLPLALHQGGENPVRAIDSGSYKCFGIPLWIWNQIKHLEKPRGTTAHNDEENLARFVRAAIDECPTNLKAPVAASHLWGYRGSAQVVVRFSKGQRKKLDEIQKFQRKEGKAPFGNAVSAAIVHKLSQDGLIQYPEHPDGDTVAGKSPWEIWNLVAQNSGLAGVSGLLEVPAEEIGDLLVESGYLVRNGEASRLTGVREPDAMASWSLLAYLKEIGKGRDVQQVAEGFGHRYANVWRRLNKAGIWSPHVEILQAEGATRPELADPEILKAEVDRRTLELLNKARNQGDCRPHLRLLSKGKTWDELEVHLQFGRTSLRRQLAAAGISDYEIRWLQKNPTAISF